MAQTQTSETYRYIPPIGTRVRLRFLSDCQQITGEYNRPVLICRSLTDTAAICERTLTANGAHDGETVTVPLDLIEPPIGWKSRYTINVSPDKLSEVISWLPRGIAVRACLDLGNAGAVMYQPVDNCGTPHWAYTELTDIVSADQTRDRIRIVKLESIRDAGIPVPCRYCNGTGIHVSNPSLESQTRETVRCELCGIHLGFSFTESWHDTPQSQYTYSKTDYCATKRKPGECWVCNGTGQGKRYLSEMPKPERRKIIAEMNHAGWKVGYQRRGSLWWQERETVIKDYGREVSQ